MFKAKAPKEKSQNAGGLPQWPTKLLIFIGFACLLLQAVSELIKRVAIMRGLMADPHAALPTPQPVHYRMMFGGLGRALSATSLVFVSRAAEELGVGKKLALAILPELGQDGPPDTTPDLHHDSSTNALIARYRAQRGR